MRLIGLTGKARAGKDTVANIIFDSVGGTYTYALASPIKKAVSAIFDVGARFLEDGTNKESQVKGFDFTYREAMQTLGTEWGRSLDKNLWLSLCAETYSAASDIYPESRYFVVTDVRFDNEAKWIKDSGGILVEVTRDIETEVPDHASEGGLKGVKPDIVLDNNGSIEDLTSKVRGWLDVN